MSKLWLEITKLKLMQNAIGDTIRSAQRDLGLKVEFVESWTRDKIKISGDYRESNDIVDN